MNVQELKPCPFCGGNLQVACRNNMLCLECYASGPLESETYPDRREAWNTRADLCAPTYTAADLDAAVQRALDAAADKCAERAVYIEDCLKWGGSKTYVTSLKGGVIELANVGPIIRALNTPEGRAKIIGGGE